MLWWVQGGCQGAWDCGLGLGGNACGANGLEEGAKLLVALLGRILLDPVRDAGEEAEGEIADELGGAVGGELCEELIFFAPEEQGGRIDGWKAEPELALQAASTDEGTVPVDHSFEGAW